MAQVTWRASEELIRRVQSAAARSGRSTNQFLTVVPDPDAETDAAVRVRERPARAGLLAVADPDRPQTVDPSALTAARGSRWWTC